MKTLVALIVALGVAAPLVSTSAIAQDSDQAACEGEGGIWDSETGSCQPGE